jgi:hypothetical protein
MALVVAHHVNDEQSFRRMAATLTGAEVGALVAILSGWVDEAWTTLTQRDGVTFEAFTADAGLWLARGEV